jgi:hypothetical protein
MLLVGGPVACDSGGGDGGEDGTFRARVFDDGQRVGRLDGQALFSAGGEGGFVIELFPFSQQDPSSDEGVFLAWGREAVPSPGRYDLRLPKGDALPERERFFAGAARLRFGSPLLALYYAREGQLRVASVSDDRVTGTFHFRRTRAERTSGGAPFEVQITGDFEAERVDADNIRRFPGY